MPNKVFGVDLGTTYSVIAHVDEFGRPVVVPNADSQPTTPSVVLFASPSEVVVGMQAKRQSRVRPDEVASLVKRHMGDGGWRFRAHGQDYSAPAVASQVIAELAASATRATGEAVHDVVVTVPAYFGDEERKATKLAGELAGLNVVDIINEPTAAAFAYGFGQQGAASETVLVYDLGGGTFDSTVISLSERRIDVIATDGDHELGGADWDERLVQHLSQQFQEAQPQAGDPLDDSYATQDLLGMAEETKQALSGRETAEAFVFYNGGRAAVTVTRAQFEELTASLLERTIELTRRVLAAAQGKGVTTIDRVLLVGGMSKSPAVARRLNEEFGFTCQLADPDLAVAKGAAIYGQKKELEAFVISDLVARGVLAEGQTLDQARPVDLHKAVASTAEAYGLPSTAVDELVATQVSNVTSRGFGLEIQRENNEDKYVTFLAHANDTLPIVAEETFGTVVDDQHAVQVKVMEQATADESDRVADNKVVIEGMINGLPPGFPRGTPVDVRFTMQRDQTIEVTARHPGATEPLVLRVEAGVSSDRMRQEERDKVDMLKRRG